jgi:hypothetical protein
MSWMLKFGGYLRAEARPGSSLTAAFEEAGNRGSVTRQDRALIHRRMARYLLACNRRGRLLWADAFSSRLAEFFDLDEGDQWLDEPVHLVTLADVRCCTSDEPQRVPIRRFREMLLKRASGLNYLGMIEPAYYVNVCKGARYQGRRAVSWHAHLLVWGIEARELERLVADWNQNLRSVAEGLPAAHAQEIGAYDLPKVLSYMLKSPTTGYRLRKREVVSPDGEIGFQFVQRKQALRKGELIRLFHLTKGLYLDRLACAGGRGLSLLQAVRKKSLQLHRDRESRKRGYRQPNRLKCVRKRIRARKRTVRR